MDSDKVTIWQELIRNYLYDKSNTELIKHIKSACKDAEKSYNKSEISDDEFAIFIDARKNRKPDNVTDIEFQINRFSQLLVFAEQLDFLNKHELQKNYDNEQNKLVEKYHPKSWLEDAANNASSVTFATHVAKLTHSKIDSPSLYDSIDSTKEGVITTSVLNEMIVDGAVAGNQYAPIYQLLCIEHEGLTLAEALLENGQDILRNFTTDENQLAKWHQRFKAVTQATELGTHALAKQIYFPVNKKHYHLLVNIVSSSLAHQIFNTLFNYKERHIKKQYFDKKYVEASFFDYPKKATLSVTASNHSNASQLNGKRGGKLYLFNTQPPVWQSQLKPPAHHHSMFNVPELNYACADNIASLRKMLLDTLDIYRKPDVMRGLENWVKSIADEILTYASQIQHLEFGWSIDSTLEKQAIKHCYLLDPYRDDDKFVQLLHSDDWQETVSEHFAHWLNQKLAGKDKQFTPQSEHRKIWRRIFANKLRDFMETILVQEHLS